MSTNTVRYDCRIYRILLKRYVYLFLSSLTQRRWGHRFFFGVATIHAHHRMLAKINPAFFCGSSSFIQRSLRDKYARPQTTFASD